MSFIAVDSESVTVDATSGGVGITASKITPGVHAAFITLETAQIRFQFDPDLTITAGGSEGSSLMEVGDSLTINGRENILKAKFIRTGGTSGVIRVGLFGETVSK